MNRMRPIACVFAVACAGTVPQARAQDAAPPRPVSAEPLPSLDELLGIEGEAPSAEDPNRAALDEVLSPSQAGEAFGQAVGLMDRVAARIGDQHDVSIATQRLQEDILRKLDQVIASAEQNQQQGGGGSLSSSSSSGSSRQQPDQQGQQQSRANATGDQQGDAPMPGGSSAAQPGDEVAPDGVGWGALPARIRDALSQGISDRYSELYRSVTEDYYKALAEDED